MTYHFRRWPAPVVQLRCGPVHVLAEPGVEGGDAARKSASDPVPPWSESLVGFDDGAHGIIAAVRLAPRDPPPAETAAALALASSSDAPVIATLAAGEGPPQVVFPGLGMTRHMRIERFVPGVRLQRLLRKLEPLEGTAPPSLAAYVARSLVVAAAACARVAPAADAPDAPPAPRLLLRADDVHVAFDGAVRAIPRFDSFLFGASAAPVPEALRAQLTSMQRLRMADATADSWRIGKVMHAILTVCAPPPALLLQLVDDALQSTPGLRPSLSSFAARLDEILAHDPLGAPELAGLVSSTLPRDRDQQLAFVESMATIDRDFVRVPIEPFVPFA